MLRIQKCDMHLFETEGQKQPIVYQIETGLFFELDTLFKSILECCESLSASQVVQVLVDQYETEEIARGYWRIGAGGFDCGWCFTCSSQCTDNRRDSCLWRVADGSFAGVLAHFSYMQYPVRLLLCPRWRLWR